MPAGPERKRNGAQGKLGVDPGNGAGRLAVAVK